MKTYTIVSFIPLPDVLEGEPTTVVASARWDGLAAQGKVSILSVQDDSPVMSVTVASAPLEGTEDSIVFVNVFEESTDFVDEMPTDGTIRDVLAWVERADSVQDRRERAFDALTYEYDGRNRSSLVEALSAIVGDDD